MTRRLSEGMCRVPGQRLGYGPQSATRRFDLDQSPVISVHPQHDTYLNTASVNFG
jgi:hypothetical protein